MIRKIFRQVGYVCYQRYSKNGYESNLKNLSGKFFAFNIQKNETEEEDSSY